MLNDFPYRARAMFAFEEQDGVDVCFFGMHVQVYRQQNCYEMFSDTICYRSMAVSVPSQTPGECMWPTWTLFISSNQDTSEQQCITRYYWVCNAHGYHSALTVVNLIGYLDYMKKLGYTMAHIWACPPSEGDDYIFHCHPQEQKIPKPKRLQVCIKSYDVLHMLPIVFRNGTKRCWIKASLKELSWTIRTSISKLWRTIFSHQLSCPISRETSGPTSWRRTFVSWSKRRRLEKG